MIETATLESISQACGVSHITVSRALRGLKNVRPETAKRIRDYADSVGYKPNPIARSLARGSSGEFHLATTASIIAPFNEEAVRKTENTLIWDYVEGAVSAASSKKSSIEVIGFRDGKVEFDFIRTLVEDRRVAGVLDFGLQTQTIDYLLSKKVPLASRLQSVHGLNASNHASVYPDHIQGYLLAWKHLFALGHQRIGYIARTDHQPHLNECVAAACLLPQKPQLEKTLWLERQSTTEMVQAKLTAALGPWSRETWPTAFFCSNDEIAHIVIVSLNKMGLRVPEDVSILGFDDSPASQFCNPPISTLHNPRKEIGAAMLHLITDMMAGRPNSRNRTEVLAMKLIPRKSVLDLNA